jgi:hypothetical protein
MGAKQEAGAAETLPIENKRLRRLSLVRRCRLTI